MKNITDYGHIFNPIVVNESYQIIDGQGRWISRMMQIRRKSNEKHPDYWQHI